MNSPSQTLSPPTVAVPVPDRVQPARGDVQNGSPPWRSGLCAAVRHRFEVAADSPHELKSMLTPIVNPLRVPEAVPHPDAQAPGRYRIVRRVASEVPYELYYEGQRITQAVRARALVRFLTWHINRQMIEKSTTDHVVLHAAAATRAGITVMLPGDQEHGKTTTVAGLLREGYDYVTDEAVAVDPAAMRITPFPKALSIDDGSWALFPECRPSGETPEIRQWQVPAETLGSRSLRHQVAAPLVIVFPRFVAGASTRCSALSRAEAVREMAQATFHFPQQPVRNLHALAALARDATVVRLRIGSLDDAIRSIEALVSQRLLEKM